MVHDKLLEVLKILRAEKARLEATIAIFERLVEESRGRGRPTHLVQVERNFPSVNARRDTRPRRSLKK